MDRVHFVLLELLVELDALFSYLDIPYCTANELAWDCWFNGRFTVDSLEPCIAVRQDAIEGLADLPLPPDRAFVLDELLVGGRRVVSARYVAENTTFVRVGSHSPDHPGLAVRILPVRRNGDRYIVEAGADVNVNELIDEVADTSVTLDYDPLESSDRALFEGIELHLPAHPTRYLEQLLGPSWERRYRNPTATVRFGTVVDADTPYETFLSEARKADATLNDERDYVRGYWHWRTEQLDGNQQELHRLQAHLYATAQRFKLCERYLPAKRAMLEAWSEGRQATAIKSLGPYISQIKRFYPQGVTVHFDEELFQMAVEALRLEGWEHADELEALVDEDHRAHPLSDIVAGYLGIDS